MADETDTPAENEKRLVPIRVERPNPETVELLEELLAMARTGELQDMMVCCFGRETYVWTAMTGSLEVRAASLGLNILRVRLDGMVLSLFGGWMAGG